ncbi:MAG: phosphoglucomutase/phosphomannomutase family protein [Candidatus Omnitrophica bacterium]|nr:phosphoglucomutase/phosphomannomutase family protein [Candidatus Omnitrophota bacterium]
MSHSGAICFGTSGWRAIIADEFTFGNVNLVTQAIAEHLLLESSYPKIVVGYDTRFLSKEFAKSSADVLAANGIQVLLSERDVPTPVIAYQIIKKKQHGGINFTASHNPPEYNGIKFSPAYGGPAPTAVTQAIEQHIARLQKESFKFKKTLTDYSGVKMFDPGKEYLKRLESLVDFKCIKKAKLKVGLDCMYGTSRGYLDKVMKSLSKDVIVFNDYLNPLFGGFPPEPDIAYIKNLINCVKNNKFDLGLACDGDADRFGIVDRGGSFLTPNEVFTLLFYYLIKYRGKERKVARTFATTHMIDAIARKENIEVVETPVGFKFIGQALSQGDCLIGGEESGGLSIQGHIPEKDGILACLLIAEMVAREKKTLRQILTCLYKQYGSYYSYRINLHFKQQSKQELLLRLEKLSKLSSFGNLKIKNRNLSDGFKFIFENDEWVMFRLSGTEPVIRCYFEARSKKKLAYLNKLATDFVKN